ncbi:tRNA pseudouridine synthase [Nesidiocoris tenuis]|uniref:tRNA pseudouridine synthase n=1 Tax=Nesidiocoris tenuis TaxID=355587 RepID=A0ABN7B3V1_9HEMI|nr:tRNA pseudouridine synthase [Nesidiocoris tenuis]
MFTTKAPWFSNCLRATLRRTIATDLTRMSCSVDAAPLGQKRPQDDAVDDADAKKAKTEFQRVKRKKSAILICYNGKGYLGLQRNPGRKTIEEDLLAAWLKVGVVTDEIYNNPRAIDFQRAARTDKGVSAVRQILSAKLPSEVDIEAVNDQLPEQIRMVAVKRATKGFNSKGNADARTYSYMMPSFALKAEDDPVVSIEYRISQAVLDRANQVLGLYLGTHNFHNFTSKKHFVDPSANRFIISAKCSEPEICEGMEFVTVYIKGQSFMLHQIRKMVGLAIAVVRGVADESVISKAWEEDKLDIPIAPGLGLVLEEVHYDRYNQRYGSDGMHDSIEWSNEKEFLDEFKRKHILSSIVQTEKEENSMITWLESLSMHTFDVRLRHRNTADDDDDDETDETKTTDDVKSRVEENGNSPGPTGKTDEAKS